MSRKRYRSTRSSASQPPEELPQEVASTPTSSTTAVAAAAAAPAAALAPQAAPPQAEPGQLLHSFVLWNNKGGVGKSTLTFHISTEYAAQNPDINVLVIDMCPQASVSLTLLTQSHDGKITRPGCDHVEAVRANHRSVGALFLHVASSTPVPDDLLVKIDEFNPNVPANMFLLCGDSALDHLATPLDLERSGAYVVGLETRWSRITLSLKRWIEKVVQQRGGRWTVFIDTNPAFSVYTQIAVVAATNLIVPFNPDDYSKHGAEGMFTLLHGAQLDQYYSSLQQYQFAELARANQVEVPPIKLFICNRAIMYSKKGSSSIRAMQSNVEKTLLQMLQQHAPAFAGDNTTEEEFRDRFFAEMRDMHTVGIASSHLGIPLHNLQNGKLYLSDFDDSTTDLRKNSCVEAHAAICTLIDRIIN